MYAMMIDLTGFYTRWAFHARNTLLLCGCVSQIFIKIAFKTR